MSPSTRFITGALAALTLASWSPALAADGKRATNADTPPNTRTERSARNQNDKDALRPHPGGLVEANWIIGARLHDADGKDLGKIEEVWLDPKTGQAKE